MQALAASCSVRICVARHWLEVALRQIGKPDPDDAAAPELAGALLASGDDLLELVIAIATSEPFLAP
jgi:hypothetical protein